MRHPTTSGKTEKTTPAPRGRPRSPEAEEAILRASLEILEEVGYGSFSIEGVAARARVGRPTIYRRWPSKLELVVEAVTRLAPPVKVRGSGDALADVRHLFSELLPDATSSALGRAIIALATDPEVHTEFSRRLNERYLEPRRAATTELLQRAVRANQLRSDVDLGMLIDLIVGASIYRWLVTGKPVTRQAVRRIADTVLDLRAAVMTAPLHCCDARPDEHSCCGPHFRSGLRMGHHGAPRSPQATAQCARIRRRRTRRAIRPSGREGAGVSGYLPIAEHGVIGDLRSAALVGTDGTVDWYCPDRFDRPSVFASLLDQQKGGYFRIAPDGVDAQAKQVYLPQTNVLVTRFLAAEGVCEVQDFMPPGASPQRLVRRVLGIRGGVAMRVEVEPRFNYAADHHSLRPTSAGVVFTAGERALSLAATTGLTATKSGVQARIDVHAGQSYAFALTTGSAPTEVSMHEVDRLLLATVRFWRSWLAQGEYQGRWREMVERSALVLRLLNYGPTGAYVAAVTTSLPEVVGGGRNWDYRYAWVRDFAFTVHALLRLGFDEEAQRFERFGHEVTLRAGTAGRAALPEIMYGVAADSDLSERELDHLEGYKGSRPVRVGNAAVGQLQLDILGEALDSFYIMEKRALSGRGQLLSFDTWSAIAKRVDWVAENWDQPDEGVWEVRGGRQRFTYSRVMCWVALDRAVRIATARSFPADLARWTDERDRIYNTVMQHCWSERRQAFVQYEGSDVLDASLLLMPLFHFIAPTDPRWLKTLDAIAKELVSDSLVYRYNPQAAPDGQEGNEGTFSVCTFWYVECLARAGRLEDAQLVFEKMLTHANHLGLYAEQIGLGGEQLGNFPQAFTHLGLISAAVNLDRALSR